MLWNGEVANCRLSKAEHGVRAGTRRPSQASARGDAPRGRTRLAGGRYLRGRDWLDSGGVCAVPTLLFSFHLGRSHQPTVGVLVHAGPPGLLVPFNHGRGHLSWRALFAWPIGSCGTEWKAPPWRFCLFVAVGRNS